MTWAKDYPKEEDKCEKLLGIDNLKASCAPQFKKFFFEKNSLIIYTLPDCTDLCAVTDTGLKKLLKHKMHKLVVKATEADEDAQYGTPGVSPAALRDFLRKRLSEAWKDVCKNHEEQRPKRSKGAEHATPSTSPKTATSRCKVPTYLTSSSRTTATRAKIPQR